MTKKSQKSPQEKKGLSYAKDRRNTYGENDKASRKAIPARKAAENRKVRRKAAHALEELPKLADELADLVDSSLRHDIERVGGWKKSPDAPLGDFIQHQRLKREIRSAENEAN